MLKKLLVSFLTLALPLFCALSCHALGLENSLALTEPEADVFSEYNITLYNPSCSTSGASSGCCNPTFSSDTDAKLRLKELVEQCGEWAMDMQREYGTPWEAIFLHVYDESSTGAAKSGVGYRIEQECHKYNWMGYTYGDSSLYGVPESEMGDCKVYQGDNGLLSSEYETLGDMFAAYYTDYTRNGAYNSAYAFTDPANYDLEKFLESETNTYASAGWAAYGAVWRSTVKDIIDEVSSSKNWPTSAELAKKENIKIGGKWEVIGDVKDQLSAAPHSLHACSGGSASGYSSSRAGNCSTFQGDYPQYHQANFEKSDHAPEVDDWTDDPYGPGETVASAGCGACSMAMLATVATGQDIYPMDIINLLGDKYYYENSLTALDPIVGEKYGFTVEKVEGLTSKTEVYDQMKKYLQDGYMLHFSGEGCHEGFATPHSDGSCTAGHYVGIFSITDGDKVAVANSGYMGNTTTDLQNLVDAFHRGYFVAIKGSSNRKPCASCDDGSTTDDRDNSEKVLSAVEEIISLANKNGSTYTWGGGHFETASQYDALLKGPINVDCTGFASLVMYKAFGEEQSFSSSSIAGHPSYEEIDKKDARPGDIFAYSGHGGVIIEVTDGQVTKIAETGGQEGRSGGNNNIGYSGPSDFSVRNTNSDNGHIYRYKGNK